MKSIVIVCLVGAACSATFSDRQVGHFVQNSNFVPHFSKDVDFRFKRQSNATAATTTTTTTARPRKNRPGNIFHLISELVSETRNDTSRAINEIGNLFNSQFSENTPRPAANQHTVSSTTPDPNGESDEDNEVTTTTEPYRITRQEFFGILRSNVRGLMRLFQKEFTNALRDSNANARQFGKEFRNAIMPYVT
ncbi:UNVERIFIED_CONTAM: hypothetical protein PYX00_010780 [Menopon gallinae]|uniref:Uncharacterized protein n=1 Tax=Menopon gallinae TaxID=328185 RepID=A0AAW2HH35_9NEOP